MNWIKNITLIALINFLIIIVMLYIASSIETISPKIAPQAPTPIPSPTSILTPSATLTPAPTARPTFTPTSTPKPQAGKCIITVDGRKYDVTFFRSIHSGGNIFICGTDQSVLFHSKHSNSFLSKLARYLFQ